jgi:proteasome lid subunit RPN8/RPN11
MKIESLRISIWLWMRLIHELRARGFGQRESGAFLLRKQGSQRITKFICYDDMDPTALDSGIIIFHGAGFVPLWKICRREGMSVAADVHTHSDDWTGQSDADRTHPMIGKPGHVAMIVPHYAQGNLLSLSGVGIYEYAGSHRWHTRIDGGKVSLTLFPWPR